MMEQYGPLLGTACEHHPFGGSHEGRRSRTLFHIDNEHSSISTLMHNECIYKPGCASERWIVGYE
jgi:hypothetical protein